MFLAAPRAKLAIDAKTQTTVVGQNLISPALWGADASVIPAAVYAALNNARSPLPLRIFDPKTPSLRRRGP